MTDLIERRASGAAPERVTSPAQEERPPKRGPSRPAEAPKALPGRVLVAVVAASLSALCFSAAQHYAATTGAGAAALGLAGWFQLAVAALVIARPTRQLFVTVVAGNAGILIVSAALESHGGGWATGVRLGLGASLVVLGLLLLAKPRIGSGWDSSTSVLLSVIPLAVVVLTVAAVAAPPPTTGRTVSVGAATSAASETTTAAQQLAAEVPGITVKQAAAFVRLAQGNSSEQTEKQPYVPLDPKTQAVLSQQLAMAEEAALRFPTVADAKAAGMVLAGGMAPGVGAHYQVLSATSLKGVNPDGTVNPAFPASWIYACTADSCPVVGVMYESLSTAPPKIGFAGPNDHWHQHTNLCIKFSANEITVPFDPDSSVTPQQCANVGGTFMSKTVWMVHAWVVPGWESPQGVFSHANLHVLCPGNTLDVDALGFCKQQA